MAKGKIVKMSQDKKWQAEDDLRTLRKAEEIKSSSSRTNAAKTVAKQEMKALSKISKRK